MIYIVNKNNYIDVMKELENRGYTWCDGSKPIENNILFKDEIGVITEESSGFIYWDNITIFKKEEINNEKDM